jgi:hypothetical protein
MSEYQIEKKIKIECCNHINNFTKLNLVMMVLQEKYSIKKKLSTRFSENPKINMLPGVYVCQISFFHSVAEI